MGVMTLMLVYLLVIARCMFIAIQCSKPCLVGLLRALLALTFFVYIFVNMGMGLGHSAGGWRTVAIYQLWRLSNCDSVYWIWYSDGH